jgi:hypothetical protein
MAQKFEPPQQASQQFMAVQIKSRITTGQQFRQFAEQSWVVQRDQGGGCQHPRIPTRRLLRGVSAIRQHYMETRALQGQRAANTDNPGPYDPHTCHDGLPPGDFFCFVSNNATTSVAHANLTICRIIPQCRHYDGDNDKLV